MLLIGGKLNPAGAQTQSIIYLCPDLYIPPNFREDTKSSGTVTKFAETSKLNTENQDHLEGLQQYDLVSFDHQSLNENIGSKQGLSISVKGIDYRTDLKRMNFKTIDDGIYSYTGKLAGVENSDVLLTTSGNVLIGHITINNESYWIRPIESHESAEKPSPVHVIYNSNDVDPQYFRLDNDSINQSEIIPQAEFLNDTGQTNLLKSISQSIYSTVHIFPLP